MAHQDLRNARLDRLLQTVLAGKINLSSPTQCKQFLEAICIQPDPPLCVENIFNSPHGISSLQTALASDTSESCLNGQGVNLLKYLQAPAIKTISGGQFLTGILSAIVESPSFWTAFIAAFKGKMLNEQGQISFAWVLLHILQIPGTTVSPHLALAREVEHLLVGSPLIEVRSLGQKIKKTISIPSSSSPATATPDEISAGGRHDNDFADFREIAVLPTTDEIASKEPPFLRTSAELDDPLTERNREEIYLDNHFRLLREDMIYELREELQIALNTQPGRRHRGIVLEGLKLIGCDLGVLNRRNAWSLTFECDDGFPQFKKLNVAKRKVWLKDNFRFLKSQSLTTLIIDGEVMTFPTIRRNEDMLVKQKPQIVLQLAGDSGAQKLLLRMKTAKNVKLIQIDVAVFAYEPVLNALKSMKRIPLADELLLWKKDSLPGQLNLPPRLKIVTDHIKFNLNSGYNIRMLLGSKDIVLDPAQERSLISGLTQNLSIIQGPPGTGKSFIGALLAKFIYSFSHLKILVVCYTNHALDQFLEDLLQIGIPSSSMVRVGGKSTAATEQMLLQNQVTDFRFSKGDNSIISCLKSRVENQANRLTSAFNQYLQTSIGNDLLLKYLNNEEKQFFFAFRVPYSDDGMTAVGKGGRSVNQFYLIESWRKGEGPGIFCDELNVLEAREIWSMPKKARQEIMNQWIENIRREEVEALCNLASSYNDTVDELQRKFREKDGYILKSKRIIGCTTTAAAKYTQRIHEAAPDVVLVEEAGEILESHVVTAMGHAAKQLILIGDHKQLRPKVKNYQLTVEKGEGYDLNMSLFERLVLKGYPHGTLVSQHRMRPEISSMIRHLTYPDLQDAPKTKGRPDLLGVQDNVIFINHDHPENEYSRITDRLDVDSKSSKENLYEARMVLKIVRYMAQQGYGTDKMVVLTPYLGQLRMLQQELNAENDPVLNDLDSCDLIRAGLLLPEGADTKKRKLRLATIDNYQGEESDIVIASLTRSNANHDIGFMFAPERLNVLLSRARNGLIMIGDSNTFTKSKKGGALWQKFFANINTHIYDGFPIKCEKHPNHKSVISSEAQFEQLCPEGGCNEPCATILRCGLHKCPSKCHKLSDHSQIRCEESVNQLCPKQRHISKKLCFKPVLACEKCDHEMTMARAKRQKELEDQRRRDWEEAEHLRKTKAIEAQIAEQHQLKLREAQLKEQKEKELLPKLANLINRFSISVLTTIKATFQDPAKASPAPDSASPSAQILPENPACSPQPTIYPPMQQTDFKHTDTISDTISPSEAEWKRKKTMGAVNPSIDSIMDMKGLENVKSQVLKILDKIEGRAFIQGTLSDNERYNLALLGSSGTAKIALAQHYTNFLASLGVLQGNAFSETTGLGLVVDGIDTAKVLVAKVINVGGGAIFIDEAYRLKGSRVLDFLLDETERNYGKVIFILAGSKNEMEKVFEDNPRLVGRVPYRFELDDSSDDKPLLVPEKISNWLKSFSPISDNLAKWR